MRFMLWISARAQDRREIAAGRHSQSTNQGTERLDRHAAFVGEDEGHDVDRVAFGVFARRRPRLVVAGGAGECAGDGRFIFPCRSQFKRCKMVFTV